MKFLCDQCKAKYQIDDQKVVGKTVRMKCRKCGHMIEVKAEVTETSVAKSFPPGPPEGDQTIVAPMPGDLRAPAAPKLATSLSAAKPAPRPSAAPREKGDALADAFHKNVDHAARTEGSASRSLRELAASDEWYVAINGVPVGPIRMAEMRRKAASGAVTEDSLCWQEGLEEWRPLKTFPELLAAVQEAVAAGRPSLTPAPGEARAPMGGPRMSAPSAVSAPVRPSIAQGLPPAKPAPLAPAARSNVVPITSRLATAEKLEEPPPSSAAVLVEPVIDKPLVATSDPFAAPLGAPMVAAAPAPPMVAVDTTQKKAPPWIPIAMVVLAAAFGVTAAYAIFFRPQVAPAPVVIVSAAAPPPTAPPTTNTTAAPTETVATVDDVPAASAATSARASGGTGPKVATAASTTGKVMDPEIAKLLGGGPGGPAVGPGAGGSAGGSSLTSDQIEAVVRNHQTGVKRTCWERGGSQQAAVNVKVHVVIGPTGSVQSANAEGNDPIVSKCIENSVRGWQFPPTGATTNVDIPFHFLRQ